MKNLTCFALSALVLNGLVGCGDNLEPEDTMDEEPMEFPSTCAELAIGHHNYADADRNLYLKNDPTKPWKAYCDDLQGKNPKEYLTVGYNSSTYTDSNGDQVRTDYDKVRIDPKTLMLDTTDQTFAISTGSVTRGPGAVVTSMPLGVAMSCGNNRAFAQVDVNGTPFVIEDHFRLGGLPSTTGHANPWSTNKVFEMWAEGDCGWIAPDLMDSEPINNAGGYLISLRYE
jgi:hypothetical protein